MDQGPLVEMQIEAGKRLVERLVAGGATLDGYRKVGPFSHDLQMEGAWIDPLEVKLIGPNDPVAIAVARWETGPFESILSLV